MGSRLRTTFLAGLLAGLVLAVVRAVARSRSVPGPVPAPLAAPRPALPVAPAAVTGPQAEPVVPASEPVVGADDATDLDGPDTADAPPAIDGEVELPFADAAAAWVAPVEGACPEGYPVKAKESSRIFHVPGGLSYDRTRPDRCYRDAASAEADGFRAAKR